MKLPDAITNAPGAVWRGIGRACAAVVSAGERFANLLLGVPSRAGRSRIETEFLPAALEIVETPPSPIGRAVAGTIVILAIAMVTWASVGRIDIVATAPGKIVATGGTKIIQPFETGVIKAIHVRDGQRVKAGDLLIELDTTISDSERVHLQSDLLSARLDVARLNAALGDFDDPLAGFVAPANAEGPLIEMQRQLLLSQVSEQRSKLSALDRQIAQREAERVTIAATIEKLKTTIPYIEQRVDIRKGLADKELGSKLTYLENIQQLNEMRYELAVQRRHYEEATAALATTVEQRAQAVAEYRRTRGTELAEAERKAIGLREDVIKAEQRARLQTLAAPIDGVVQQLAVHTIGGVVTAAQPLLSLVPIDSHLEVEANVSNRDIGFVADGAKAQIKIDTFNFTRYGFRHGTVLSVSRDAIMRQKPQDNPKDRQQGAQNASSEPSGQELIYSARVSLDKTQMRVDDNIVDLTPGMAVTVEISTGSRTVMSYLLSPLSKYAHDSLRER
jgi:hemolysin D